MAYSGWQYKKQVKFDTTSSGADVSGNVSDFPVLVRLTSSGFDFSQAKDNGEDMRFADSDGTELSYQIERWDKTGQTADIWVLVPQVDGDSDTDYIEMYWGNSGATDESNGENVFQTNNDFAGVWHLNEDPAGG